MELQAEDFHKLVGHSIDAVATRAESLRKQLDEHTTSLETDESALAEKKAARAELFEHMQVLQQRVYNIRSEKENADNVPEAPK